MKALSDHFRKASSIALLSGALIGDADSNPAGAAEIQATFNGRVAAASGPDGGFPEGKFYPEQDLTLNVTFNSDATAEPGGDIDFEIYGGDSISSASLTSGHYDDLNLLTLPGANFITIRNQTDPSAIIGDSFLARIEADEFSIEIDLFAFFPDIIPGPISSANLDEALQNLGGFGQGGFNIADSFGGIASGSFHEISLAPSLSADFDKNGVVNQQDLGLWQGNYGVNSGAIADADNDGDADGRDFLAWQQQITQIPGAVISAVSSNIPEPGGLISGLYASLIGMGSSLARFLRRS